MILGVLENPKAPLNDLVQISARLGVEINGPPQEVLLAPICACSNKLRTLTP